MIARGHPRRLWLGGFVVLYVLTVIAASEFATVIGLVESTAQRLGHSTMRLPSGAGHDAQMLARVCPSGMVFVPSVAGISHNPAEYTAPEDLVAGADVLLQVMLELASGEQVAA